MEDTAAGNPLWELLKVGADAAATIYGTNAELRSQERVAQMKRAEAMAAAERNQALSLSRLTANNKNVQFAAMAVVGVAAVFWILKKANK
jgi:hypothetical protein